MTSDIPVIDLQAFPGETTKLIEACEKWGCFRIVNYEGILPESLLQEMRSAVKPLFALPEEIKMRNRDKIPRSGYLGYSDFNTNYEGLGFYDASCLQDIDDFCSELEASPIQRNVFVKYVNAVTEVLKYIANRIGEGLGVKGFSVEDWSSRLRFNHYNFVPNNINSQLIPLHTDASLLTLLDDDKNIRGYEVMKKSGEFVAVDPCPSTLLVNLGDIAHVWSNGRFLNVKHRVMGYEEGTRLTIGSFLLGPKAEMVEIPPELVDSEHPRLFSPFSYNDFINSKVSKNMLSGESLDFFRI